MSVIVHVSFPVFYQYEGWIFEYSRNKPFGPWPCKKDYEPRKRAGRKFWDLFGRFDELTESQQEEYRI